jgi:transposase-like protein
MAGKTHRIGPSLIDTAKAFATEEACHAYLEAARWPEGVTCLKCGHSKVSKYTEKGKSRTNAKGEVKQSPDRFMYQCLNKACKYRFAATTGTIFSDTHLPLSKWMMAVALMCNAKKGMSAKQMERDMDISYKTAWYLNHRIRKAMNEGVDGLFTGTVEADETYIGGKYDKRRKRGKWDKEPVFGMKERETGRVHIKHVSAANRGNVAAEIEAVVSPEAKMMTDESNLYANLTKRGFSHEIVIHSNKEWVRGDIHTQGIDGFWSLLKRGLIGSFHQVSIKHLHRYMAEFQFRFNGRQDEDIFAGVIIGLVIKDALRYKSLTAQSEKSSASETKTPDPDEPF